MATRLVTTLERIVNNKTRPDSAREMARLMIAEIVARPELAVDAATDAEMVAYTFRGRRFLTTLPRLATRQLGFDPEGYASKLQNLSDAYRSEMRLSLSTFQVISGQDIIDAYRTEIGGHSCMTGPGAGKLVKLYSVNQAVCSMLVLKCLDTTARALLWTDTGGKRFLDRIYPNSGWHISCIEDWARGNNVYLRSGNGAPGDRVSFMNYEKPVFITALTDSVKLWPYMDTFAWVRLDSGNKKAVLCNQSQSQDPEFVSTHFARSTTGSLSTSNHCNFCGTSLNLTTYLSILDESNLVYTRLHICTSCLKRKKHNTCRDCGRAYEVPQKVSEEAEGCSCMRCGSWARDWRCVL